MSTITVAPRKYTEKMIEKGLLKLLAKALVTSGPRVFEHIVWTLCNLLGEESDYKITLQDGGFYDVICEKYDEFPHSASVDSVFSWFISNSMKSKPLLSEPLVS